MIQNVFSCFFSPCGNVKKAAAAIGKQLAEELNAGYAEIDFTLPEERSELLSFSEHDLVILGTPVYAGRVPNKIMPFIRSSVLGNGAFGIPVVVFGNRAFDDALSELRILMEENGFRNIAAAAVVSEHSFAETLAAGRPDADDLDDLKDFAHRAAKKLTGDGAAALLTDVPGANPPEKYYTPLREDGEPAKFLKAVPKTDLTKCTSCGKCSEVCPMGSVEKEHPEITTGVCIKCQACIHVCPPSARYFDDADFLSHRRMLLTHYDDRKESSFFI